MKFVQPLNFDNLSTDRVGKIINRAKRDAVTRGCCQRVLLTFAVLMVASCSGSKKKAIEVEDQVAQTSDPVTSGTTTETPFNSTTDTTSTYGSETYGSETYGTETSDTATTDTSTTDTATSDTSTFDTSTTDTSTSDTSTSGTSTGSGTSNTTSNGSTSNSTTNSTTNSSTSNSSTSNSTTSNSNTNNSNTSNSNTSNNNTTNNNGNGRCGPKVKAKLNRDDGSVTIKFDSTSNVSNVRYEFEAPAKKETPTSPSGTDNTTAVTTGAVKLDIDFTYRGTRCEASFAKLSTTEAEVQSRRR